MFDFFHLPLEGWGSQAPIFQLPGRLTGVVIWVGSVWTFPPWLPTVLESFRNPYELESREEGAHPGAGTT